jgi:hypothetical protein
VARYDQLNLLVKDAVASTVEAYHEGRISRAECVRRVGRIDAWLRAKGVHHAAHPPLLDPRRLVRRTPLPEPPVVFGRLKN